jgi:hypothetical protein
LKKLHEDGREANAFIGVLVAATFRHMSMRSRLLQKMAAAGGHNLLMLLSSVACDFLEEVTAPLLPRPLGAKPARAHLQVRPEELEPAEVSL